MRWITFDAPSAPTVAVTVDAHRALGTIPATAFGMNATVWDGHLLDGSMPSVLRQAGVTVLRFPGGSSADNYHWQTNSFCNGGYANPTDTFDAFMGVARATGAQPLITVNYGSNAACDGGGDPAEAAAWVRYANVTKGYGVKYWEIGNEVYGNGTYPGGWETDLHAHKGPAAYASNAAAFVDAMKAADPSIKVGIAVTTPGYWPDGQAPAWNSNTLAAVCAKIDFVDVHWYPIDNAGADANLLASTGQIAGMMSTLRAEITAACGARANQIQILLGEMNTNSTGKQRVSLVDALFLADGFMTWLEDGAANTSWWDLHNGIDPNGNNSPSLYGTATYGDLGLLSGGGSAGGVSEPPVNTPFPPYYGLQMLTKLGAPGDTMVAAASDQALVTAHAVRQANGNLALMLVNKSPDTTYNVTVSLSGYSPASAATIYSYGMQSRTISTGSVSGVGTTFAQSIPPYSLTTVVMIPPSSTPASTATPPGIPDAATPTSTPSATATNNTPISTPSATPTSTATPPGIPDTGTPTPGRSPIVSIGTSSTASTNVAPGETETLAATVTTTIPLAGAIVDFYVYDASGHLVTQIWQSPVALAANTPQTVRATWSVPAYMAAGTYTLKVGVFGTRWSPLYAWNDAAATLTIGMATPLTTPATSTPASTATSTVGSTATSTVGSTATSTVGSTATSTVGSTATSTVGSTATSTVGSTATSTPTSTATSTPTSTATSTVGSTATSTPTSTATSTASIPDTGTPTPPSIPDTGTPTPGRSPIVSIGTSSTASTNVAPGETETLAATVTTTIPLAGAIVDFYVYDASGHLVTQIWQSPVALAANTPQTVRATWSVPAYMAAGTYTLKVGVFGTRWSPLYAWNDAAATLTIGMATSVPPFNNNGISSDRTPAVARFDPYDGSYSTQALQSSGLTLGHQIVVHGVTFAWPNVAPGAPDNIVAHGQTIRLAAPAAAATLAFLGAASNGPSTGTGTVTYTDGSTQSFALGFSDWTLNDGALTPRYGNIIAATLPYRNHRMSREQVKTYVFYAAVPLQAGKTVASVTLPATVAHGQLHVFALSLSNKAQP